LNDTLTASPDPFATSLAGRKLGRYEVLARLASGGMAGVYVARAIGVAGFERLFAIKVLHPHLAHEEEFISMFLDEARLAARIRHPNVVPTLDISDTPDAGFYLVMEYIEGDHLGALLQKAWKLGKRLPFPVTLRIVVDALEGLAAAHNLSDESGRPLQLVHRDVSPHNIMVSSDGVARITDFGVAKAEVRLSTTREGQFKGKLAYMAPEHASNGDADQRSDLFSMAIILWESLAGRRLFRAENHAATLNKICLEPIPLLSSVDAGLTAFDPLLAKALSRDPNERFQTAEEFAEAIEEASPTIGGLAKAREVAGLVREYAAEKLGRDAELIRSAIATLTASGGASSPPPALDLAPPVVEMPLQGPPLLAATAQHIPEVDYADIDLT
jgi:eukaryotic-like serine/threonine-protein kinase